MIESLREAFRQAVINFRTELRRDAVPEAADELLRAMRKELVLHQGLADRLEVDLQRTRDEAAKEKAALETCLRREELALRAGDEETASVAREFAGRHLRRQEILSSKANVLGQELDDHRRTLVELTARFKEARFRRESLAATAGRTEARERVQATDVLFDEMDRMEERIQDLEAQAGAAEEMDGVLSDTPRTERAPARDVEIDTRLEELKRGLSGT